jgi:hypothetical protein
LTQDQHQDLNLLEDINRICRAFRRQFSQGKPPRLEIFLLEVGPDGRENLFSNLLEIELNYRRSKKQNPTSSEYLKRFPNLERAVRRAFFEPTVGSYDSANDEGGATRSLVDAGGQPEDSPTFSIPDANRLGTYELVSVLGPAPNADTHLPTNGNQDLER